ncbi:MAG TPA: GTP cyclohydrolase [Coxiellaceae bacterium]|nr:GTP cyclohydrolase [Coxiellaceae bacterium]
MHMFIIELTYTQPIDIVEQWLASHKAYLQEHFASGEFIASGPKIPRDGGIIVCIADQKSIQALIEEDPFYQQGIAEFRVREFKVSRHHDALKRLVDSDSSA